MSAIVGLLSLGSTTYASEDVIWETTPSLTVENMNAEITPPIEEVVTPIEETSISTDEEVITNETSAQEELSNTEESFKQNETVNIVTKNMNAPAPEGLVWQADVYIKKTASILVSGNVGDSVVYTLTYGNSWDVVATWVTIFEDFPNGVSWNLAWWTNVWGSIRKITLADLAPWAVWSVMIDGTLIVWNTLWVNTINLVEIATSTTESSTANNSSYVEFKVYSWTNNCNCFWLNTVQWTVYVDVLRNNVLDTVTDTKVPWVTVNLMQNWIITHTTTTDINWWYSFGSLPNGVYSVSYVAPIPWLTSIISNIWDKWWLSPTVTTLTNVLLSWWVTWLSYNFGLIPTPPSGWGGGWFGWWVWTPPVVPTIPTTPTVPTQPTNPTAPSIPLPPLDLDTNAPIELLETWPLMLLETWPNVAEEIAIAATTTKNIAKSIVQNIDAKTQSVASALQYVDVTRWFDAMMYAIITYSMYMIVAALVVMMSMYAVQVYARD